MVKIFVFSVVITIIILFIWATIFLAKQSKKDWATLEELTVKANKVRTKEEIEDFYKEFLEKSDKIHNQYITPYLTKIDGYLKGLYKQYESPVDNKKQSTKHEI